MRVEIYTVDNLIILGNLAKKELGSNAHQNISKLLQNLEQESKSLHLTEAIIYKNNGEFYCEAPFIELHRSQIVLARLIPNPLGTNLEAEEV